MRVLVLGASGMLGHKVLQVLGETCQVYAAVRGDATQYGCPGLFDPARTMGRVEAADVDSLVQVFAWAQPDAVVNAVGIVKQRPEANRLIPAITINSLLPHRLSDLCAASGARLIHLSTDCVFSGVRGAYTEDDTPDPVDVYGRSKLLGEATSPPALTLRTSMVGREIGGRRGLLEWLLSQEGGRVCGFRRAIFSGLTTLELSRVITRLVLESPSLTGLYHVAAEPISKYDLLTLIGDAYGLDVAVDPDDELVCDRSLVAARFREVAGYAPPPWPKMIEEMRDDPTPYAEWSEASDG